MRISDAPVVVTRQPYAVQPGTCDIGRCILQAMAIAAILTAASFASHLGDAALVALRMCSVWWHEMGHSLAALASGGTVKAITVTPDEGGWAESDGGMPLLVTFVGYPTSALVGALALAGSRRRRSALRICAVLGLVALASSLFLPMEPLARRYAVAIGVACTLGGIACLTRVSWGFGTAPALRVAGTYWLGYTFCDVCADCLVYPRSGGAVENDAVVLGQMLGLPVFTVAMLWLVMISVAAAFACWWSVGVDPPVQLVVPDRRR